MADELAGVPDQAGSVDEIFDKGRAAYSAGDYQKALPLLQKAADMGNNMAVFLLGEMCRTGGGVPQDPKKAMEYYRQSADMGNPGGQYMMGLFYTNNIPGVENPDPQASDVVTAATWFEKSAEQGVADSQYRLGALIINAARGEDGNVNEEAAMLAMQWFEKAASSGHKGAKDFMDKVTKLGNEMESAARGDVTAGGASGAAGVTLPVGGGGAITVTGEAVGLNMPAVTAYNTGDYEKAFALWTETAEKGDAESQKNLGTMYYHGQGVAPDMAKSFEWYLKAAEQGNSDAQRSIGSMYYQGIGVPRDMAKAMEWYTKVAEQGDAEIQYMLGYLYFTGQDIPQDKDAGIKWITIAADGGYASAQFDLAELLRTGTDVPVDGKKALDLYHKASAQGNKGAQCALGLYYCDMLVGIDNDDDENMAKAIDLLGKAADQGYALAQYILGDFYRYGDDVLQDTKKALDLYHKAAEQGNSDAQYLLGLYYNGTLAGIPNNYENPVKAAEWFTKAAAQGHAVSLCELGDMLRYGRGLEQDGEKAIFLYHQAAEQGCVEAQYQLGLYYFDNLTGIDNPNEDHVKAKEWFEKAAEQGHADAQFNLGQFYHAGEGTPMDAEKALEMYREAAENGHAYAQFMLGLYYIDDLVDIDIDENDYVKAKEWFEKAAAQGHADSMYNLGLLYASDEAEGIEQDNKKAVEWLLKAVEAGSTDAKETLDEWNAEEGGES